MNKNKFAPLLPEQGSSLFAILLAITLFAALTYVLSQQRDGISKISEEKLRLLASDVIDMGTGYEEAISKIRLRRVPEGEISFQNTTIAGYTNAACTTDECKIFAYSGGGKDWETPTTDINAGKDWGFTGNLAVTNIGTSAADLVAVLPDLSLQLCNRINTLAGIYGASGTPTIVASATANKFTGTYSATPDAITGAEIDGQKSACIQITSASGTAITGAPLSNSYVYYHVLMAR